MNKDFFSDFLEAKRKGMPLDEAIFTIDKKIDWMITLNKQVKVFNDLGRPVINLKPSDPTNKNVLSL